MLLSDLPFENILAIHSFLYNPKHLDMRLFGVCRAFRKPALQHEWPSIYLTGATNFMWSVFARYKFKKVVMVGGGNDTIAGYSKYPQFYTEMTKWDKFGIDGDTTVYNYQRVPEITVSHTHNVVVIAMRIVIRANVPYTLTLVPQGDAMYVTFAGVRPTRVTFDNGSCCPYFYKKEYAEHVFLTLYDENHHKTLVSPAIGADQRLITSNYNTVKMLDRRCRGIYSGLYNDSTIYGIMKQLYSDKYLSTTVYDVWRYLTSHTDAYVAEPVDIIDMITRINVEMNALVAESMMKI